MKQLVRQYILQEFLPGEDPANLTGSVQLIRGGILDSLAALPIGELFGGAVWDSYRGE